MNEIEIAREFRALCPGSGEITPVMLEEDLFQIAIPEAAGAQPIFKITRRIGRSDQL